MSPHNGINGTVSSRNEPGLFFICFHEEETMKTQVNGHWSSLGQEGSLHYVPSSWIPSLQNCEK